MNATATATPTPFAAASVSEPSAFTTADSVDTDATSNIPDPTLTVELLTYAEVVPVLVPTATAPASLIAPSAVEALLSARVVSLLFCASELADAPPGEDLAIVEITLSESALMVTDLPTIVAPSTDAVVSPVTRDTATDAPAVLATLPSAIVVEVRTLLALSVTEPLEAKLDEPPTKSFVELSNDVTTTAASIFESFLLSGDATAEICAFEIADTARFPLALTDDVPRIAISGVPPPTMVTSLIDLLAALAVSKLSTIELILISFAESIVAPLMSTLDDALLVMTEPFTPARSAPLSDADTDANASNVSAPEAVRCDDISVIIALAFARIPELTMPSF